MAGERHGNGVDAAWARHVMCKSAFTLRGTYASTLSCRLHAIFMGCHRNSLRLSLSPPDDKLQLQLISRLTSIHI